MPVAGTSGRLRWLLPRFNEDIPPEFYRNLGKLRCVYLPVMVAFNWVVYAMRDTVGIDEAFWFRHQVFNTAVFAVAKRVRVRPLPRTMRVGVGPS